MNKFLEKLKKVKLAGSRLAFLSASERTALLMEISKQLSLAKKEILKVNHKDMVDFGGKEAFKERLRLDEKKFFAIIKSVTEVAGQPEVVGKILEQKCLHNGLTLRKISVPLGVVGVIYESRPNVTVDLAILAVKSGNSIVLKGGKESYRTNLSLVKAIHKALEKFGLLKDVVFLINPQNDWREPMLNAHGLIDVLVPRGGAKLIEFVRKHACIPIIETGAGVCHIFADDSCNLKSAVDIVINAKTQRPGVCNALDTLVVHKKIMKRFLKLLAPFLAEYGVEIFADRPSFSSLVGLYPKRFLKKASVRSFGREFLSLKMSIKTVESFAQGLSFIKLHTSGHSEAILTENKQNAEKFLAEVDAAAVYHNASIRFTDGGEFGMGAEVGISTQKLHARGPMGAMALTSYKWVIHGTGQVRP